MQVAIAGCGQLARMLALAGWQMGMRFSFLADENESDSCVHGLGKVVRRNEYTQIEDLYFALGSPQVITVEKEYVDIELLKKLQRHCPVHPEPEIIRICQHRGREKEFLRSSNIPTAPFEWVRTIGELPGAVERLGFPVIIKSCEQGYDGLNQWRLKDQRALDEFMQSGTKLPDSVVESFVSFSRELSLLLVRSYTGDITSYPAIENRHRNGILLTSIAPAGQLTPPLLEQTAQIIDRIMSDWNYVGVLAIECFEAEGEILVNEMAPRVHNSGHWTQQGAMTSQFENHLRAITAMLPGRAEAFGHAAMVNLLGCMPPALLPGGASAHLHLYNKTVRPGRKVGHINLIDKDRNRLERTMDDVVAKIYGNSI